MTAAVGEVTDIPEYPRGWGSETERVQWERAVARQLGAGTTGLERSVDVADGGSVQAVAGDTTLTDPAAADGSYVAGMMGNLHSEENLTALASLYAGVVGEFNLLGTTASTIRKAGIAGGAGGDGALSNEDLALVLAYVNGDSGAVFVDAMFGVENLNSTPGTGANFGLDLQRAAHDGYTAIDKDFYAQAPIRLVEDVVVCVIAGVPVDYTDGDPPATGEGVFGPGSLVVDITGKKLYINTGTKAEPAYTLVGAQS